MSVGIEIKDDGAADSIAAAINRAIGGLDQSTVDIVAGGARGAERNAVIARVQKARKRDPFYLADADREAIKFALRGLTSGQFSTRVRALTLAGELLKTAILRHVDAQENPDGSAFTPLTNNYANAKRRKFGFVVPILKASGDLLQGLMVRITTK